MKVLAINCGSSSLKFEIVEVNQDRPNATSKLAEGKVQEIGSKKGKIKFSTDNSDNLKDETVPVAHHAQAIELVWQWLESVDLLSKIEAVGHRIVHGGDRFTSPILIDKTFIETLEALIDLAPLHNAPSLMAIRAAREQVGEKIPMVATFDTIFHRNMPDRAARYAIPYELAQKHQIRRYGFHGLAHRYLLEKYATIANKAIEQIKIITLQLGGGCSAAAIANGHSIDTSMGFTPLEGLMMGTRSGDIDPALITILAEREGISVKVVEELLNQKSGLLGVSGISGNMSELVTAESQGDIRAALAIEMFCYRIRKYIGAYLAVLNGADAIIFGGGIGENNPLVRDRICQGMDWCGLILDPDRNKKTTEDYLLISSDRAQIHAYAIAVNEAQIIARDTYTCLSV
jgi:acetate kinase